MCLLNKITGILSSTVQNLKVEENFEHVSILFESTDLSLASTRATVNESFEFVNQRDNYVLSIIIDNCDPIILNANSQYDSFKAESESAFGIKEEGSLVQFQIQINKSFVDNTISVYFIDELTSYIESLPFLGVFHKLNEFFQNNAICFESQIEDVNIKTSSIVFVKEKRLSNHSSTNRKIRIEKTRNLSFCELFSRYFFIPEDFHIIESDNKHDRIEAILYRLEQILSIVFLFDIVEIKNNRFIYKLNGHKSIIQDINIYDINLSSHETYYKIYEWAYVDGNVIDKVGLARNVLSLYVNISDLYIEPSVIDSIQSNHKMYLRGNLKQYIEIRNKISEQLFEFKNKADKVVDGFVDNFKKTLISVVSFYASVIVIRVLSKNSDFTNIFTGEIFILSTFFIVVAVFMLIASRWELNKQIQRYKESYLNLKSRHLDLLDQNDIDLILNNDRDFNDNISYIEDKKKVYNRCWLASIIMLFTISLILYQKEGIVTFLNKAACCIMNIFQ